MIIPNDFVTQWHQVSADVLAAVERVGQSGWYILGQEVQAFEQELAKYWNLPFAVGVANGLDAIEIGLRALGCKAGDRVLTTPLSAFATTLAILKIGAIPVFADVDQFGLIDLEQCERILTKNSSIRFFVPVHLYGYSIHLPRLEELKRRFNLLLVEDCAQAIGAKYEGRSVGSVGELATVSFYPTKNLGAFGDGGALLLRDAALVQAAKSIRDYGQSSKYVHDVIGMNSRLDELHAGILRTALLPRLDEWLARRRVIAKYYSARIQTQFVKCLGAPDGVDSAWHLFPVRVNSTREPNDLIAFLRERGVVANRHYPMLIPNQKVMKDLPHEIPFPLTTAQALTGTEVSLPIHPFLSDEQLATVVRAVNEFGV